MGSGQNFFIFTSLRDQGRRSPRALCEEVGGGGLPVSCPSPQYMGCVEVLQSMRALDFNTRTQVTRLVGVGGGGWQSQDSRGVGRMGHLVVVMAFLWVVKRVERKLGK